MNLSKRTLIISGVVITLLTSSGFVAAFYDDNTPTPTKDVISTTNVSAVKGASADMPTSQESKPESPTTNNNTHTIPTTIPTPVQQPTKPIQQTKYVAPQSAPKCTDDMRTSIEALYQANITAESSRYDSALRSAMSDLQSRGLGFSGQADVVQQQQANIHQQRLAQIENDHQIKLAQYEC